MGGEGGGRRDKGEEIRRQGLIHQIYMYDTLTLKFSMYEYTN